MSSFCMVGATHPKWRELLRSEKARLRFLLLPPRISTISIQEPTFALVIERFITEERLDEIRAQPPGETTVKGLKFSTACSYTSMLQKHIKPRWGTYHLSD